MKFTSIYRGSVALALLLCSLECTHAGSPEHTVTVVAHVPGPGSDGRVYISGNRADLGDWDPGAVAMDRQSDRVWTKTFRAADGERVELKVSGGSWWEDSMDSTGNRAANTVVRVRQDTTVVVEVPHWLNTMRGGKLVLTSQRLQPSWPPLTLDGLWRFHSGDDSAWAGQAVDDAGWSMVDPNIVWKSGPRWEGIGWFRFHMYVDSALWTKTFAFMIRHLGASEVYLNGRLLYRFGSMGTPDASYQSSALSLWKEITLDPRAEQVIAVRYANARWKEELDNGVPPGFLITLKDLNSAFNTAVGVRHDTIMQMVFTVIPLVLSMVHLFVFIFYRRLKQNLFYGICLIGFAGLTYFNFQGSVTFTPALILLYRHLNGLSAIVAIFFGLLTFYTMTYPRMPKRWWGFAALALLVGILGITNVTDPLVGWLNYAFFGVTVVEVIVAGVTARDMVSRGGWLILTGFILLNGFIILQLLIDQQVVLPPWGFGQVYVFGMLALGVSMSLFLGHNFARVNLDLEAQLANVKLLSEKTLEQERRAVTLEMERRIVALEDERKGKELEEARALQLSLLPREIPQLEGYAIACAMKTAAEVGGDYYDFACGPDGALTVAIGDATGHGMKAGMMVVIAKTLFNSFSGLPELLAIFDNFTSSIKKLDLHALYMSMLLLRLKGNRVVVASAGMPAPLLYRRASGSVEEIALKGMPLGGFTGFPYQEREFTLAPGDTVVLMSDGFSERFNERKEELGEERVRELVGRYGCASPEEVVRRLLEEGDRWANGVQQNDDMTFVVITRNLV